MMNKKYFFALATVTVLGGALIVFASPSNIQYPVEELDNCASETACRVYCDNSANAEACLNFAEKNNLMTTDEVRTARKFLQVGSGPGGCTTKGSCETYCDSIEHMDECISFAEKNNLIPPEELEEAKKVQAAIRRGIKPPPCGNKKQCDIYCNEPEHMEVCITFGIEAGFIQGEELEDVQKMLAAVKRGVKPPPCKGKEECDEYCALPDNMETCMIFALEAGFMPEEERADAQKMLAALKKGVKPPACQGREECDIYCAEENHFEECLNFAEAAGFMSSEEAEMARKTGGKGPGGCKGKEECENFCDNPDNQETCFNFAKENGLIPEEDIQRMEEGKQQFKQTMQDIPSEVYSCMESLIGVDMTAKFKNGEVMPPKEVGDQMQKCFKENMPQMQENMQPGDEEHGFAPGTGPDSMMNKPPCEGDECQKMPQEYEPGTGPGPDSMMNKPPCEGDECQQMPPPPPVEPIEQQPISSTFDLLLGAILMPFVQIFQ